ncbi:MAG: tetratricopeptide repeat protein [Bacteroidia bacterium]|nr:tetratricopeptide repeat protein [Bacteroidia bacterium]
MPEKDIEEPRVKKWRFPGTINNPESIIQNPESRIQNPESRIQKYLNKKPFFFLPGILLITTLIYFQTLFNDFVSMDDYLFVTENPYIRGFNFENILYNFSHPTGGHFQPITQLTYMLDYLLGGYEPFMYHLSSFIYHLINIILVFYLTRLIFKRNDISFLVAFIFAIHPLNTATVCWTATRNGIIFLFFYLLSLSHYNNYLTKGYKRKHILFTFLFFIFAVLSKSAAISLPLLMFLFDYYYKRKISIRLLAEKIPFLMISVLGGLGAIWAAKELGSFHLSKAPITIADKFFIINTSFLFYIYKTIAPIQLVNMHFLPTKVNGYLPFEFYIAPVINLIIFINLFLIKIRKREFIFGFGFYVITIVLFLQLIQVGGTFTSERYAYLPNLGLFMLLGLIYIRLKESSPDFTFPVNTIFNLALLFLSFFYMYQTWNRVKIWKNGECLFTDYINKEPGFEYGYWAGSCFYLHAGRYDESEKDINKAVELSPYDSRCRYQRGILKSILTKYESAIKDFNVAIGADSTYAKAYSARAYAELMLGKYNECINDYQKALKIDEGTRPAECYFFLGTAKINISDFMGAVEAFDKAIALKYDTLEQVYYNRGNANKNQKKYEEAIKDYTQAIAHNEAYKEAFNNRGICHYQLKRYNLAIADFTKAIEIDNEFADACNNRGNSYYFINDLSRACQDWEAAYNKGYFKALTHIKKYCN